VEVHDGRFAADITAGGSEAKSPPKATAEPRRAAPREKQGSGPQGQGSLF
jgi:hypothetical protein